METVRVHGACLSGVRAELIRVEARYERFDRERTEVAVSGLPDAVVRESRGRLTSALATAGLVLPHGRLLLNLVPAARRKRGEMLDLPMAVAACSAGGYLDGRRLERTLLVGEVGLDGALHPVPGGLAAALAAREAGLDEFIAPPRTAREAAWIEPLRAFGASDLEQVVAHLSGARPLEAIEPLEEPSACVDAPSLDDVRGQATGKLALALAAAGGHGLLFIGPPGTGKSMLARRAPNLSPPPDLEERLEITRVLSASGHMLGALARTRPFRAPHHTASHAALVGGGTPVAPGEATLAHLGVLFLDELPEFRRDALEALRTPLEEGVVRVARAGVRVELPARFRLVAAMNPCPCGYLGHPRRPCRCGAARIERYRHKVSGPLLDRIDLRVELPAPSLDELAAAPGARAGSEDELRDRVNAAGRLRSARQGALLNADLGAADLDRFAPLSKTTTTLLERVARAQGLSARAIQSLRRVARTLADLESSERVGDAHLAQAIGLRAPLDAPLDAPPGGGGVRREGARSMPSRARPPPDLSAKAC